MTKLSKPAPSRALPESPERRAAGRLVFTGALLALGIAVLVAARPSAAAGTNSAAAPTGASAQPSAEPSEPCPSLLRHGFRELVSGRSVSLCEHRGKVLLVVNTASRCGYTPQFEGLAKLDQRYRNRGLVVVGFPSGDFGGQELARSGEIAAFCKINYGVQFPLSEKTHVVGGEAHPLFVALARASGQAPQWNFHKYLIDRSGTRVVSFASAIPPEHRDLVATVERLLADRPAL